MHEHTRPLGPVPLPLPGSYGDREKYCKPAKETSNGGAFEAHPAMNHGSAHEPNAGKCNEENWGKGCFSGLSKDLFLNCR